MNQQYSTKKYLFRGFIIISLLVIMPSMLMAEDGVDQMTHLMNRLRAIEEENRALRGQLEETQHQLSILNQQMDTLNADVEHRLSSTEGSPMPLPLPPSALPTEDFRLSGADSNQDYEKARTFLEQGDYEAAEKAFAAFVSTYPDDKLAGSSQYWLGVTYFVRGAHEKAVAAFAKGYKNYSKSPKAGDNLLKLAKSLSALDRKADACTTLDQLCAEHPQFSTKEVANERKKLNCK